MSMSDNIFEKLTDEEQDHLWMYMIFNREKIIEKTDEWTNEAKKRGMTLTEYLESINPLNEAKMEDKEHADTTDQEEMPWWIGKRCDDCGNEKCKSLGKIPRGHDCALWQEAEDKDDKDDN